MREPADRLAALEAKWRKEAEHADNSARAHSSIYEAEEKENARTLRQCADDLSALLTAEGTRPANDDSRIESALIESVKAHWFTQGGEAEYGPIHGTNADEVV